MRKCPHCQKKLHPIYTEAGVVQVCNLCSGSLVHLELLRREQVSRTFIEDFKAFTEDVGPPRDNIRCPDCSRPMRNVSIWNGKSVSELRTCQTCSVVWLKDGERRKLPDHSDKQLTCFERPSYVPDNFDETKPDVRASFERHARGMEIPQPIMPMAFVVPMPFFAPTPTPLIMPLPMSGSELKTVKDSGLPPKGFLGALGGLIGLPGEISPVVTHTRPIITSILAVLTLLPFVMGLFMSHLADVLTQGYFSATEPMSLGGATWLSSFFVYSNTPLLIFSFLVLATFGARVENSLSRLKFLLLIILAHAGGLLASIMIEAEPNIALGATSTLMALFAFYVVQFPHARLALAPLWSAHPVWLNFSAMGAASFLLVILLALGQYLPPNSAFGLFSIHSLVGIGIGAAFSGYIRSR